MASKLDGGLSHVAGRRVKIPVEEFGGSLTLGREGPSGLPQQVILALDGLQPDVGHEVL
jgi:hypothetical protein